MMSHKSSASSPEVTSARSKLQGVLQHLSEIKEESSGEEAEGSNAEEAQEAATTSQHETDEELIRRPKHMKKHTEGSDAQASALVLKLFDRSVNLAQCRENTSLYSICRAWIRNDPEHIDPSLPRPLTPPPRQPADPQEDVKPDVYCLPPPTCSVRVGPDPRIPSTPPLGRGQLDAYLCGAVGGEEASGPQLLLEHMNRWRRVRGSWHDAARRNEERYSQSYDIFRDMMNSSAATY